MNIQNIRDERTKWFLWKNIAPIKKNLDKLLLQNIVQHNYTTNLNDIVEILSNDNINTKDQELIYTIAKQLIPWRKGPFKIFDLLIDSEWQSNKKYNLLEPFFNIKNKIVADVGCNNGYYMFRMLKHNPKKLVGFDPSPFFNMQFDLINSFVKSDIKYELLGVEHLEFYDHKFDFIFMLGVLYHRSDPISSLKSLFRALNNNGEIIVDSFFIDGEDEVCLFPTKRYAMIPNVYFIPTISCFKNWLIRAGFTNIELIATTKTDEQEQRATPWTFEQSLSNYIDPNNPNLTIEGYPAPKRAYFKAKKIT